MHARQLYHLHCLHTSVTTQAALPQPGLQRDDFASKMLASHHTHALQLKPQHTHDARCVVLGCMKSSCTVGPAAQLSVPVCVRVLDMRLSSGCRPCGASLLSAQSRSAAVHPPPGHTPPSGHQPPCGSPAGSRNTSSNNRSTRCVFVHACCQVCTQSMQEQETMSTAGVSLGRVRVYMYVYVYVCMCVLV